MTGSLNHATRPIVEPYMGSKRSVPIYKAIAPTQEISGLPDIKIDESKNKRSAKLLIDATRDFGNIRRPSSDQITQYKELFYQLIDRLQSNDRRMISAMLARLAFTPRAVALYFAQDEVEIAAPFLLFSSVLGDLDLRAIAKKKGHAYAEVISKRQSPIDAHTQATLNTIIENNAVTDKPTISVPTPDAKATKWLDGNEIVALASIGGRLGSKSAPKPASKQETVVTRQEENVLPKQETRHLMSLARNHNTVAIANYVEKLCGLESNASLRLLNSVTGDELVYLVKALGIPSPHNLQFLLLVQPKIGRDIATYRHIKSLLSNLEAGICKMIFNEIGAKFEIAGRPQQMPIADQDTNVGFQEAARRRRDVFEQAPASSNAPRKSRFSFEESFMAAG